MFIDLLPKKLLPALKQKKMTWMETTLPQNDTLVSQIQNKSDTYRTNKFIKNNKVVVLEEAIPELSYKE